MSNEKRQKNRAARKAKRQERKQAWGNMLKEIDLFKGGIDLDGDGKEEPKFEEVFDKIWPVLGPALKWAELQRITGPKTDAVLNTIYTLGNQIAAGDGSADTKDKFVNSLNKIWGYVRIGLNLAKTIANDKQDDVIDDIIDVGDWMTGNDDDD